MDWKNKIGAIQNKVKFQLHARKADDLESIQDLFQLCDPKMCGHLNKVHFNKFLAKCGIFLTSQELREVYNIYDKNGDGQIHYMEFLQYIRTSMTEKRLATVKHAFQYLASGAPKDRFVNGKICLKFLQGCYKPEMHPRVLIREKSVEQVLAEFQKAIVKKSEDGAWLSEGEFLEYYADVNATLPQEKESYFVDLVLKTWGVTSGSNYVSQNRLSELQTTLYEKIRQKTLEGQDEGETIKRAFKYFDLTNSNRVTIKQFWQAMDKFGCVFCQSEIEALFNKFDKDNSGTLNYTEFANVFAIMGSGTNPNVNPVYSLQQTKPSEVLMQIQGVLRGRGFHGLNTLARSLRKSDKMKNNFLTRHEFTWTLKENGHVLTKTEQDKLFRYFDKNGKDQVSYNGFLASIQCSMWHTAEACVKEQFTKLCKEGETSLSCEDMCKAYNGANHPRVVNGTCSLHEVCQEFCDQWDTLHNKGRVSEGEFLEYYKNVLHRFSTHEGLVDTLQKSWC